MLDLFQVDAFTTELFTGNPAAVVPIETWPNDDVLGAIAAENNLSETAYFAPTNDADADFDLRWFTPTVEIDLCGHATLASAHILITELGWPADQIRFRTRSGIVRVARADDRYELVFPARPGAPTPVTDAMTQVFGIEPVGAIRARDLMCVFDRETDVRSLRPDFARLAKLDDHAVMVTAPGEEVDFVSRFFAPCVGVDEDPVTGSAHCTLAPYWTDRLGQVDLTARQVSSRGGRLWCRYDEASGVVHIAGHAVTYLHGRLQGRITLSGSDPA